MNKNPHLYHPVSRLLHWISVPLIIAVLLTGLDLDGMERGPEKSAAIALHTSLGATLAFALIARLLWRGIPSPPPLPRNLAERRRRIAKISHVLIYTLLFTQILMGDLAMLTVTDIVIWDVITIPTPFERNLELHHLFEDIHGVIWWFIAGLLTIHMAAAVSLFTARDPESGHAAWRM